MGLETLIGLGIGAATGVGKGVANQAANERARKQRAATIRYSPWTGMGDPGMVEKPGMFESVVGGLGTGAMVGQGLKEAGLDMSLKEKMLENLGKTAAPKSVAVGASTAPDAITTSMAAPVQQNFGPLAPHLNPYQNQPVGGFSAMNQMAMYPQYMRPGATR